MRDKELSVEGDMRSLKNGRSWMDESNFMLVRKSWKELMDITLSKTHVILSGKSGRGKSLFVIFMIFEILACAADGKTSSPLCPHAAPFPADPIIVYVDRMGTKHIATLSGVSVYSGAGWPRDVHYVISDNCDIGHAHIGSLLTMAVTTDEEDCLKEFRKRHTAVKKDKVTLYMPSLSFDEMKALYPDIPVEELQFMFNVVGGNPGVINSAEALQPDIPHYQVVENWLALLFGDSYRPMAEEDVDGEEEAVEATSTAAATVKQRLGSWAVALITTNLRRAVSIKALIDSSLFKEYVVKAGYRITSERYASEFLRHLASSLEAKQEKDLMLIGAKRRFMA
jgi:hypothetical protein